MKIRKTSHENRYFAAKAHVTYLPYGRAGKSEELTEVCALKYKIRWQFGEFVWEQVAGGQGL